MGEKFNEPPTAPGTAPGATGAAPGGTGAVPGDTGAAPGGTGAAPGGTGAAQGGTPGSLGESFSDEFYQPPPWPTPPPESYPLRPLPTPTPADAEPFDLPDDSSLFEPYPDGYGIFGGGDSWVLQDPDGIRATWDPDSKRWVDPLLGQPMPDGWGGGHSPPVD